MDFEPLIEAFAERNGLGRIQPEADGSYRFVFDEELAVECIHASGELVFRSALRPLPDDDEQAREEALRLLKASLARIGSQRAILCLDPDSGAFVLFRRLELRDLTVAAFEEALEDYVDTLEFWVSTVSKQPLRQPAMGVVMP